MFLNSIFLILVVGILLLLLMRPTQIRFIKFVSITLSSSILILSTLLYLFYNKKFLTFQFFTNLFGISIDSINTDFFVGLDGISIFFFLLTSLLTFFCNIFIWNEKNFKLYILLLFFLELLLLLTFSVLNLFLFYLFFESILIPMFLIIGGWGSREKKIRAAYLLFFYTVCCSFLMLISIIEIYSLKGTLNFEYLAYSHFSFENQIFFWLAFFLSFASKIPMFPFHIWLPEAHVEAPTIGSVFLAGILLKLGVYGFMRYSLTLFPEACIYFAPFVYVLALFGIICSSFTAIKQTDLKKIIAYSSIAHMNLVVLGLFCGNLIGLEASLFQSISHGFVASALFFLIGMLYNRYHSRLLFYYSGLTFIMPLYSFFFLFFTLFNIALPVTCNFIGEFLLLTSIFQENVIVSFFASLTVVFSGAYSLWLFNRIAFGNLKTEFIKSFKDISFSDFFILTFLSFFSLVLGIFPNLILNISKTGILKLFILTTL